MKRNFLHVSVLLLTLAVAAMGSLYALEPQASPDTPQAGQSRQSQPPTQAQDAKEFTGTIVKQGGTLVLKDSAADITYKFDDASKVKEYVGKMVKVTGTLDSSTNVLRVESIQIIS